MDKVKKFDEELKNIYQEAFFFQKFLSIMFFGLGIMIMMIPVDLKDGFRLFMVQSVCVGTLGVLQYMQVYMSVTENNKRVSIYKKMAFMPVSKAEIRKVRCGYLNRICMKVGTAMFVVQQISSLLNHSMGIVSVLYAAACVAFMWGMGLICIYKAWG